MTEARKAAIKLGSYIIDVAEMRAKQASDPEKAAINGGEDYLRGKVDAYRSFVHMLETSFGVSKEDMVEYQEEEREKCF
jgi:hypothetical protein